MNKLLTTLLLLTIGQGIQAQRVCYSDGTITIEGDPILTNDQGRSDLSEGRERLGMGIARGIRSKRKRQPRNPVLSGTLCKVCTRAAAISRLPEIAIRHWDGYWFGKRQTYGDVYPHYWSAITAAAFHRYAQATNNQDYQQRAENIVRGNLSLFREDGRATCAFVFPHRVNGEPAHYADAYANDQDWALLFYMLVNEKDI